MTHMGLKEALYLKNHLDEVKHVTLDPGGNSVLRLHMIPPKYTLNNKIPSVIIVNGQDIVPVNLSWAILLSSFIDTISPYDGVEIKESDWEFVMDETVKRVKNVYSTVKPQMLKDDLWTIISTLTEIARGQKPQANIGQVSIGEYAKHMKAPHHIDLMISSMTRDEVWNCNQKCLHCYAAGQKLASVAWPALDLFLKGASQASPSWLPDTVYHRLSFHHIEYRLLQSGW
jgi:hypothetical protein